MLSHHLRSNLFTHPISNTCHSGIQTSILHHMQSKQTHKACSNLLSCELISFHPILAVFVLPERRFQPKILTNGRQQHPQLIVPKSISLAQPLLTPPHHEVHCVYLAYHRIFALFEQGCHGDHIQGIQEYQSDVGTDVGTHHLRSACFTLHLRSKSLRISRNF